MCGEREPIIFSLSHTVYALKMQTKFSMFRVLNYVKSNLLPKTSESFCWNENHCFVGDSLSAVGASTWTESLVDWVCHGLPFVRRLRHGTQCSGGVSKNTNGKDYFYKNVRRCLIKSIFQRIKEMPDVNVFYLIIFISPRAWTMNTVNCWCTRT